MLRNIDHVIAQLVFRLMDKTPVILVINKTDTVKKEEILAFIDTYRKELDFQEIVPVSYIRSFSIRCRCLSSPSSPSPKAAD